MNRHFWPSLSVEILRIVPSIFFLVRNASKMNYNIYYEYYSIYFIHVRYSNFPMCSPPREYWLFRKQVMQMQRAHKRMLSRMTVRLAMCCVWVCCAVLCIQHNTQNIPRNEARQFRAYIVCVAHLLPSGRSSQCHQKRKKETVQRRFTQKTADHVCNTNITCAFDLSVERLFPVLCV